jgi:hypothetical protein
MSIEKQIEEIKDHIDSIYGCDCAYYGVDGIAIATVLYEAGYRKQSEVERLEKALAAKDAEYDQALQDKARECNMAVDKVCIAHREEIRALQEKHEAELATAKREGAWEIFAELDKMDIRIVRLLDAIKYMDLVKKYEYDHKKKYTEGE